MFGSGKKVAAFKSSGRTVDKYHRSTSTMCLHYRQSYRKNCLKESAENLMVSYGIQNNRLLSFSEICKKEAWISWNQ